MCQTLLEGGYDIVVGSRMAGAKSEMPLTRRIGNMVFAAMISLLSRQRITDSASGMRVFRREALEKLYPLPDGLNFTPIMSTRALHEDVRMVEVAIPYSERVGRSKLSVVRDGTRYVQTITWTALNYNPVRILGGLALLLLGLAGLIALVVLGARLAGRTEIGPLGGFALFTMLVLAVTGVSLFNLGATFNYLVALFHHHPVKQGLFGKPFFDPPLDRHFWWMGLLGLAVGLGLGLLSLVLALSGWPASRMWFYYLLSALFFLVGLQFLVSWILMRVLEELSQREALAATDLGR